MSITIKPSHKGRLHANLGVPANKPIPAAKLNQAVKSGSPTVKKQAVFAKNAKAWHSPSKLNGGN